MTPLPRPWSCSAGTTWATPGPGDGTTWSWHIPPPEPGDDEPSPRDAGSFAFDAATGTGVLFGGFDGVTTFAWMAAYEAVTQQVMLFGHSSAQTWTWNGATWQRNH